MQGPGFNIQMGQSWCDLPVSVWISSRRSGFLPQTKDMQPVWWEMVNCPIDANSPYMVKPVKADARLPDVPDEHMNMTDRRTDGRRVILWKRIVLKIHVLNDTAHKSLTARNNEHMILQWSIIDEESCWTDCKNKQSTLSSADNWD